MNQNSIRFLLLLLCFTIIDHAVVAGGPEYADRDFYLIDSLVLDELSEDDRELIDNTLKQYHKTSKDTVRLEYIHLLVEECWNIDVWPRYNEYLDLQASLLLKEGNMNAAEVYFTKKMISEVINNRAFLKYRKGDFKEAMKIYHQSLLFQEEIGYAKGIASSLNNIGSLFKRQGKIDSALIYFNKSMAIKMELGDSKGMANTYNNMGVCYSVLGNYSEALSVQMKSLEIRQKLNDLKGLASSYFNIGSIYDRQNDIKLALKYYVESLLMREKLGEHLGIANALNNIAAVYSEQKDYENSLIYYQRSLEIRIEIQDQSSIATAYNNIGLVYDKQGLVDEAMEYYGKSLAIAETIKNPELLMVLYNNMGLIFSHRKDLHQALKYYRKSSIVRSTMSNLHGMGKLISNMGEVKFKLGELDSALYFGTIGMDGSEAEGDVRGMRPNATLLTKVYRGMGNYKLALDYYEKSVLYRDSLQNEDNQKEVIRSQAKYEFEKAELIKEQQAKEEFRINAEATSRRDNLQYSIVFICLLVLGLSVAMIGRLSLPVRVAEGLIFFAFLIFFEFLLVLADPYIEGWSGGAPGIKLLFNAGIAAMIFPLHSIFEHTLKRKLVG